MLEGVGQGFLHQAVDGQLRGGGHVGVAALDLDAGRQPGGAHLVGEGLQLCDAGQRVALRVRFVGPQDAQRTPHVGQGLPPVSEIWSIAAVALSGDRCCA
nr:hypothetical protein GCM10020093_017280 [Planobispora longispora]